MVFHDICESLYRLGKARSRKEAAIDMIVVHHDAAPPPKSGNWVDRLQNYAHQHAAEGWGGLGYHYAISPDGQVFKCNPITRATTHAGSNSRSKYPRANSRSIGIMLMGNFHINNQKPTAAQLATLKSLITTLKQALPTIKHVIAHRDVRPGGSACPGQFFTNAMIPQYQP